MNPLENVVMIYDNRLKQKVDKCDEISRIERGAVKSKIIYQNGKPYEYNNSSFTWITDPHRIDTADKVFFHKTTPLTDIAQILAFGDWYKVFFANGQHRTYPKNNIRSVSTCQNNPDVQDVLQYLIDITKNLGGDAEESFLQKQLDEIQIQDNSVLGKLLQSKPVEKAAWENLLIFPFSTNLAQQSAVMNALQYDFSVIQGPPGTGKTQTILNIIANILLNGQTVAIVSGNNEATRNVDEKLLSNGFGYIGAFLGNKENIETFFAEQTDTDQLISQFGSDSAPDETDKLEALAKQTSDYLKAQLQIAELRQKIGEYEIEQAINDAEYQSRTHAVSNANFKRHFTSSKLLELASVFELLPEREIIGFFDRVKFLFRYGIVKIKDLAKHRLDTVDYLQNAYYGEKIDELLGELQEQEKFLSRHNADEVLKDYSRTSTLLLQNYLHEKYSHSFGTQLKDEYKRNFEQFTKRYPIVFSTTHSLKYCSGTNYLYDYLIIDESSQVDLASAFIALSCAKHVTFVGDIMQLPPVVKSNDIPSLRYIFDQYHIPEHFEYAKHSILQCILEAYPDIPNVLLNEHYRCDPQIIGFCNKRFYHNQLVVHTEHKDKNGVEIITTEPHYARGRTNQRQADIILEEILPYSDCGKLGIVAPYRDQVTLLKEKVSDDILVDTVHKFQGKEKDVIVMSTVSNRIQKSPDPEHIDFLNNPNLINVAISRAKQKLYILASSEILKQPGSLLRDFEKYVSYFCSDTVVKATTVYSVFDLMYNEYAPILESLKQRLKKVSVNASENIAATVIDDICRSGEFGALDYKFEYPLRKILAVDSMKEEADRSFAESLGAHCDFVLFSALDKSIQLIIEIDGSQHKTAVQQERDQRKDRLLQDAGLTVLRIGTTEVNVEEKMKLALREGILSQGR